MKTTVELPGELLRRVKARAALEGRTFKALLIEALRDKLRDQHDPQGGWRALFGRATKAQVSEVDRRIAQTERIDTEDWK